MAMGSVKVKTLGKTRSANCPTNLMGTCVPINSSPKRLACCVKRIAVSKRSDRSRYGKIALKMYFSISLLFKFILALDEGCAGVRALFEGASDKILSQFSYFQALHHLKL